MSRKSYRNIKLLEQNNKCYFCNQYLSFDKATLDHLLPRSLGGNTSCVVCCQKCNKKKGSKLINPFTNKNLHINELFAFRLKHITEVPYCTL